MKIKYTPGPWKLDNSIGQLHIFSEAGEHVQALSMDTKLEDAYLIAAAPELLEQVKEFRKLIDGKSGEELDILIAKAESRI